MAEDADLLSAYAHRGDVASLEALVRRHAVWMQALLRGMLSEAADVEDAFQQTWERVIRSASSYRGGNVRAYLAAAARSVAVDRLRRTGRTVSLDAPEGEGAVVAETATDPSLTPRERAERRLAVEDVRRAVCALPEGPRQVLLMRLEGELKFKEIAAELGVPLGTALTWMDAAVKRLKQILGEENGKM